MLNHLKNESNMTWTENGAATLSSTLSECLDLFATIGAIRRESEKEIIRRFFMAYAADPETAMKILFFGRDVRGGLGERRVFRVIARWLADYNPESMRKNIALIPEYGRFDDLTVFIGTACEKDALEVIRRRLETDLASEKEISLLAKWLPSVNASNVETVRMAKRIARYLGMKDVEYRKMLSALRRKIKLLENYIREKDYSFDYEAQPSKAMFKYRNAFLRNDSARYLEFLNRVEAGTANMHTGTLVPYEIIEPCFANTFSFVTADKRRSMDVTWNALEDFTNGENALAVVDVSGSMCWPENPRPISVSIALGIYFAERNRGTFHGHFISFSQRPQLIEIKGRDIFEKVQYCAQSEWGFNTNLQAVFELILNTAVKHQAEQKDLPKKLYIISDMEFDFCTEGADIINFDYAKTLFSAHGYELPEVIFWNVASRNRHQPVTMNEQGVALVSGCTPRIFSMTLGNIVSPYAMMMKTVYSERYAPISA